jgi:hypothetical protein
LLQSEHSKVLKVNVNLFRFVESLGVSYTNTYQSAGSVISVGRVIGIVLYAWCLYELPLITDKTTFFFGLAGILVIGGWMGWVIVTTPPQVQFDVLPFAIMPEPDTT